MPFWLCFGSLNCGGLLQLAACVLDAYQALKQSSVLIWVVGSGISVISSTCFLCFGRFRQSACLCAIVIYTGPRLALFLSPAARCLFRLGTVKCKTQVLLAPALTSAFSRSSK